MSNAKKSTSLIPETFALHSISSNDEKTFGFDPALYSKFKFGCKDAAEKFGHELAIAFFHHSFRHTPKDQKIVVLSSPYCFIPTATFAMKDYFVRTLNDLLITFGFNVVEETKIHRTITYKEDYGELSAEERYKLIQNDGFHIDVNFIKGKTLLLLDDIKITGSHERVIERMVVDNNLLDLKRYYIYFAELVNQSIDPKIENFLNYYYVKDLISLDKLIKNENFLLNTRVVKFMLNFDPHKFREFITYQRQQFINTVYHLAIGNSYHLIPEYQENLLVLKSLKT